MNSGGAPKSGKRIAVVGTGANGAAFGADMTRAGLDVTFIEQWPAHVEAMRANGIRVEMPDETQVTPVRVLHLCEVATLREPFDIVLIVVKAYDTRWACELIKPLLRPDALVIGMQNGMTMDDMASIVGPERTLGAVIEIAANMFEPGVVDRQTAPVRNLVRHRCHTTRRRAGGSRRSPMSSVTPAPSRSPTTSARRSG